MCGVFTSQESRAINKTYILNVENTTSPYLRLKILMGDMVGL